MHSPFWNRLVGAGGVDLEGGLAVQPVVGAAHADALRGDDADMARGEGLAEGAGVEDLLGLVGHGAQTQVALGVNLRGEVHDLLNLVLHGVDLHLHLVEDGAELLMQLAVQHLADVLEGEALFHRTLADAHPHDVALADVHDALDIVDQVVELTLQNRLEVRLHLAAGDLHQNGDGQVLALLDIADVRAFEDDLAVLNLVHLLGDQDLHAGGPAAAALHEQIVLADALALKGRAEGHGDVDLGDADLQAAHLDGLLDDLLVGHIGDHVLVGADAGGQHLRGCRSQRWSGSPS